MNAISELIEGFFLGLKDTRWCIHFEQKGIDIHDQAKVKFNLIYCREPNGSKEDNLSLLMIRIEIIDYLRGKTSDR